MVRTQRFHLPFGVLLGVAWLAAASLLAPGPARAEKLLPPPSPLVSTDQGVEDPPPAQALCPDRQVDQRGTLVERCAGDSDAADYAIRVYDSPFDTGRADWVVSREMIERFHGEELVALFGSGAATIKQAIEEIVRQATADETDLPGGLSQLEATVQNQGVRFVAAAVVVFALVFGGVAMWLLVRRQRRHFRRINAGRRTAAALMGELITIRDGLRDLALDSRPGRLEDLERLAANTHAFASNQGGLRLIDRAASGLIIGFYAELRALPEPYIEERAGKLGTHRVLRLEAADEFAVRTQAMAARANELAGLLRQWLDENLGRD